MAKPVTLTFDPSKEEEIVKALTTVNKALYKINVKKARSSKIVETFSFNVLPLTRMGLQTMDQVAKMTYEEFLSIKGVGAKATKAVLDELTKFNIGFAPPKKAPAKKKAAKKKAAAKKNTSRSTSSAQ